jgi:DNA-binding NarL/FixJ family response regulator
MSPVIGSRRFPPGAMEGQLRVRVAGRLELVVAALERDDLDASVTAHDAPSRRGAHVLVITDLENARQVEEIKLHDPAADVVAVVRATSVTLVRQLLEAGVVGVVTEADVEHALGPVLRAVVAGQVCVPADAGDTVAPPALSTRERQVLALMAGGLSNAEIAEQLFLSESTVKTHAASAFRRLGVRSRREAVAVVLGSSETLRRSVLMSHPFEAGGRGDRRSHPPGA